MECYKASGEDSVTHIEAPSRHVICQALSIILINTSDFVFLSAPFEADERR